MHVVKVALAFWVGCLAVCSLHSRSRHASERKRREISNGTTWLECSYDWDYVADPHTVDTEGVFGFAQHAIDYFRSKPGMGFTQKYVPRYGAMKDIDSSELLTPSQGLTMDTLLELLDSAGKTLDDLGLNWYITQGSAIGWLRFVNFIPWDTDVDLQMPKEDALKLHDYLVGLNNSGTDCYRDVAGGIVGCLDPNNPKFLAVSQKVDDSWVQKNLWVDMETELSIDGCLLCVSKGHGVDMPQPDRLVDFDISVSKKPFGNIVTNVATNVWDSPSLETVISQGDIDNRVISMISETAAWTCTAYTCEAEPPQTSTSSALSEHYAKDPNNIRGPFHFKVESADGDVPEITRCSLPRDYGSCSVIETTPTYMVAQCED